MKRNNISQIVNASHNNNSLPMWLKFFWILLGFNISSCMESVESFLRIIRQERLRLESEGKQQEEEERERKLNVEAGQAVRNLEETNDLKADLTKVIAEKNETEDSLGKLGRLREQNLEEWRQQEEEWKLLEEEEPVQEKKGNAFRKWLQARDGKVRKLKESQEKRRLRNELATQSHESGVVNLSSQTEKSLEIEWQESEKLRKTLTERDEKIKAILQANEAVNARLNRVEQETKKKYGEYEAEIASLKEQLAIEKADHLHQNDLANARLKRVEQETKKKYDWYEEETGSLKEQLVIEKAHALRQNDVESARLASMEQEAKKKCDKHEAEIALLREQLVAEKADNLRQKEQLKKAYEADVTLMKKTILEQKETIQTLQSSKNISVSVDPVVDDSPAATVSDKSITLASKNVKDELEKKKTDRRLPDISHKVQQARVQVKIHNSGTENKELEQSRRLKKVGEPVFEIPSIVTNPRGYYEYRVSTAQNAKVRAQLWLKLGTLYFYGDGGYINDARAAYYFNKAAKQQNDKDISFEADKYLDRLGHKNVG